MAQVFEFKLLPAVLMHAKGYVALENTAVGIGTDRYVMILISDCAMINPAAQRMSSPCKGQAHDALEALRQVIQGFNYNLWDNKNNVHGIAASLRSASFLSLGLSDINSHWRELR
jgi:hypothetical protein